MIFHFTDVIVWTPFPALWSCIFTTVISYFTHIKNFSKAIYTSTVICVFGSNATDSLTYLLQPVATGWWICHQSKWYLFSLFYQKNTPLWRNSRSKLVSKGQGFGTTAICTTNMRLQNITWLVGNSSWLNGSCYFMFTFQPLMAAVDQYLQFQDFFQDTPPLLWRHIRGCSHHPQCYLHSFKKYLPFVIQLTYLLWIWKKRIGEWKNFIHFYSAFLCS